MSGGTFKPGVNYKFNKKKEIRVLNEVRFLRVMRQNAL